MEYTRRQISGLIPAMALAAGSAFGRSFAGTPAAVPESPFQPLTDSQFRLESGEFLTLIAVRMQYFTHRMGRVPAQAVEATFLRFSGPPGVMPEAIHRLDHESAGRFEFYIRQGADNTYTAVLSQFAGSGG